MQREDKARCRWKESSARIRASATPIASPRPPAPPHRLPSAPPAAPPLRVVSAAPVARAAPPRASPCAARRCTAAARASRSATPTQRRVQQRPLPFAPPQQTVYDVPALLDALLCAMESETPRPAHPSPATNPAKEQALSEYRRVLLQHKEASAKVSSHPMRALSRTLPTVLVTKLVQLTTISFPVCFLPFFLKKKISSMGLRYLSCSVVMLSLVSLLSRHAHSDKTCNP